MRIRSILSGHVQRIIFIKGNNRRALSGGKNFEWSYCKRDETAIREYLVWMDTMLFLNNGSELKTEIFLTCINRQYILTS